mmetsp:Transcript_7209/g.8352  ORF Transcript_7209/g.8352 Transcript_7209/m.8352 type:complete len:224 (-) Transcript_7209:670-1341(-)|eukprot:CAMPEP_0198251482 /NCGR_PEP_ID=MMETSP1447-20131203/2303_1 /TAXON_ID=420782 /ORGANISM="Chaetoceros dichaeta, Strain CCMP1751" /LENGTH=223 /DNA_ID=CAMNT_0043936519 /DNA_START=87 /DNA_END=758 /DNA_ORIENTATION=+
MLQLKKKRAEEAKAKKEEEERAAAEDETPSNEPTPTPTPGGLSLLGGVGGKKAKRENGAQTGGKKRTPCQIRLQKDMDGLSDFGTVAELEFPDANNLTMFRAFLTPDEGYWAGAKYQFTLTFPDDYPHKPPKVLCNTKIYHPNIDLQGNICINMLREDWKPIFDINNIIIAVSHLFTDPEANDPLNKDAGNLLRNDKRMFASQVKKSLKGGSIQGEYFTNALV